MRLTLRTLLAYLDDTLEPGEIKQIGQKVAESDAAQELVARIKQVTRRRRLTTPPDVNPGEPFDANRIAAYLDNELSAEELAEIEKICLESDVHLSEISAAHQILTLVLGEPALVPPTARRRMYALIHGRPTKPSPKPTPVAKTKDAAPALDGDHTDDTLIELPIFRAIPWLKWAVPLAAAVLLIGLGIVFVLNLGGPSDNRTSRNDRDNGTQPENKDDDKKDERKTTSVPDNKDRTIPKDKDRSVPPTKDGDKPKDKTQPDDTGKVKPVPPVERPSEERVMVGSFETKDQVLVRRDKDEWKRLAVGEKVPTNETLVSLPGYKSDIKLDRDVNLKLWGTLSPELFPLPLGESSITLHQTPPAGVEVDLTLHRGRVYATGRKARGEVQVRVRFRDEVWDITLEEAETMIGVELLTIPVEHIPRLLPGYRPQRDEEPFVQVAFYIWNGRARLKNGSQTFGNLRGPTGQALYIWNNKGPRPPGPLDVPEKIGLWNPEQPLPEGMREKELARSALRALEELHLRLAKPNKRVEIALQEYLEDKDPDRRFLGTRCLAALDSIEELVNTLARDDLTDFGIRSETLFAVQTWLSRGLHQNAKLYDPKTRTGLLTRKGYNEKESAIIIYLLQGFTPDERSLKATYGVLIQYLLHEKLLIRDLAIRNLLFMAPGQNIAYDPAGPAEQRERGQEAWKRVLDAGKLPPPPK